MEGIHKYDQLTPIFWEAMVRYVAQRGKLCGTTLAESALVDMVAEGIKDARGEDMKSIGTKPFRKGSEFRAVIFGIRDLYDHIYIYI